MSLWNGRVYNAITQPSKYSVLVVQSERITRGLRVSLKYTDGKRLFKYLNLPFFLFLSTRQSVDVYLVCTKSLRRHLDIRPKPSESPILYD